MRLPLAVDSREKKVGQPTNFRLTAKNMGKMGSKGLKGLKIPLKFIQ